MLPQSLPTHTLTLFPLIKSSFLPYLGLSPLQSYIFCLQHLYKYNFYRKNAKRKTKVIFNITLLLFIKLITDHRGLCLESLFIMQKRDPCILSQNRRKGQGIVEVKARPYSVLGNGGKKEKEKKNEESVVPLDFSSGGLGFKMN